MTDIIEAARALIATLPPWGLALAAALAVLVLAAVFRLLAAVAADWLVQMRQDTP